MRLVMHALHSYARVWGFMTSSIMRCSLTDCANLAIQ